MEWLFWTQLLAVSEWVIRLTMLPVIVLRKEKPATCLAWLAIVFFEPWIGLGLYLLIGENRLGRRRLARRQQPPPAAGGLRVSARRARPRRRSRRDRRLQRAGPSGRARRRAAGGGRQLDLADVRHRRGHRPADRRDRRRPATRPPAVLHLQGRRGGPARGRGVGAGGRARRGVPRAGRRRRLAAALSPPGPVAAAARRAHLSRPAGQPLANPLRPARSAQPSQAGGDRRRGRLHRLAEHRRGQLRPQAGGRLARHHGPHHRARWFASFKAFFWRTGSTSRASCWKTRPCFRRAAPTARSPSKWFRPVPTSRRNCFRT